MPLFMNIPSVYSILRDVIPVKSRVRDSSSISDNTTPLST